MLNFVEKLLAIKEFTIFLSNFAFLFNLRCKGNKIIDMAFNIGRYFCLLRILRELPFSRKELRRAQSLS